MCRVTDKYYLQFLSFVYTFGLSVWPLSIRSASRALSMESRDVRMSSIGMSSICHEACIYCWYNVQKQLFDLIKEVGLSTGRRCLLKRSSPFCLLKLFAG